MVGRDWGGTSIRERRRDRALVIKGLPNGARIMVYDRKSDQHLGIKITTAQVCQLMKWVDQLAAQHLNQAREIDAK